jgi:gas vesicle protein
MNERDSEGSSTGLSAFVAGALVGAGVALLLAPHSGSEVRGMLRRYASRAKDRAVDQGREAWDTAVDRGKDYMETGRKVVKEAGRTARECMETGKEAVRSGMETGKEAIKSGKESMEDAGRDARNRS